MWKTHLHVVERLSDIELFSPQVAMKVVVDNFAILGIEFCLLDGLRDMLSSDISGPNRQAGLVACQAIRYT
jgi:hypothetical protein